MATKTISITDEAYEILKSWKTEHESFSDVIKNIGKRHRLTEFAGILSNEEVNNIEREISASRRATRKRAERLSS